MQQRAESHSRPLTIVLDAGHGGDHDVGRSTAFGVRGAGGLLEKDVTLKLARKVAEQMGRDVVLTRHGDVNLSLADRAAVATRFGAGVFVSLHANSGGARGAEAWVHRRASEPSRELAAALGRELAVLGGGAQPRIMQEELAVLTPERLPRGAAACLLEVDDLSDPQGATRLGEPRGLDQLAGSIARGLRRFVSAYGTAAPSIAAGDECLLSVYWSNPRDGDVVTEGDTVPLKCSISCGPPNDLVTLRIFTRGAMVKTTEFSVKLDASGAAEFSEESHPSKTGLLYLGAAIITSAGVTSNQNTISIRVDPKP